MSVINYCPNCDIYFFDQKHACPFGARLFLVSALENDTKILEQAKDRRFQETMTFIFLIGGTFGIGFALALREFLK